MSDGKTWSSYLNELPAMEGIIVKKLNIDSNGDIAESGTEISKIYGTDGSKATVSYAATSAISGSVSGVTYAPSGLNALYRIQGLDWNDYVSYESSTRVTADISNPYASAQQSAEEIMLNDPNIHGFEITYKEVNGQPTQEVAVQFLVHEKKPIKDIPYGKRIPKELSNFKTDVKQTEPIIGEKQGTTLDTSTNGDLIIGNSVTAGGDGGTLGLIMVNTETGKLVASTASHVPSSSVCNDGIDSLPNSQSKSAVEGIATWSNNGASSRGLVDRVSIFRTSIPFHKTDIATLNITNLDKATPFVRTSNTSGQSILNNGPIPWALPSDLTVGMTVHRKAKNGNYYTGTLSAIEATGSFNYGSVGSISLGGLIRIVGFNEAGDSGCPWFATINGRVKYIGMQVVGAPANNLLWVTACWYHNTPIQGVPVKPWNGDLILTKRTTPTLNMYGRVYEFVGYTTLPATHTDAIIDP